MKASARTLLKLEHLESRELPSTTDIFASATAPNLPSGWSQWSNDGSTVFDTAAGAGIGGGVGVVSTGSSGTSGMAWETQGEPAGTSVSVDVNVSSLVPTFVFADGSNLGTSSSSYLAAVVTRGVNLTLLQVTNGSATVLGSVASPSSAYFSGNWAQVSIVPNGTSVEVQVVRQDTGQYLNSSGTWQSTATSAITATSSQALAAGEAGIGRFAAYSGAVELDDFAVSASTSPPVVSPPPPPPATTGSVVVNQTFDATAIGATPAGWQTWNSNGSGTSGVSSAEAFSAPNGYAFTGSSNTSQRAWSTAALPASVSASTAIYLDSLIPAELFVDGANLGTGSPTYDAVELTRGVGASLVQVVNGSTTTLGTVSSTSTGYLSGQWAEVEMTVQGSDIQVSIYRTDAGEWLTSNGTWSSTPSYAFNITNAQSLAAGEAGIGRLASYAGTVAFDNFSAGPLGTIGPGVTVSASAGSSTGSLTLQASVAGGISQLAFLLNGKLVSTSTSASANYSLNTSTLANGSYTVTVLAGGTNGTVGAGTYDFTVANSPPPPAVPTVSITPDADPASAGAYSAVPSTDTLFGPNGPSYLDVEQGQAADCWLIASLAEVAARDPQALTSMFTYDGTTLENGTSVGVYTVRFYNSSGVAKYVTIDTELPDGGSYYDQPVNGVLWVALAEKAYAVANGLGYVTTSEPGSNSYAALGTGDAQWALQAITGVAPGGSSLNPTQLASNWTAGDFIVLSTVSPSSSEIVGDHDYAVVGYNASTGEFELMNPWGGTTSSDLCPQDTQVYGLFSASGSFVLANFSSEISLAGAANSGTPSSSLGIVANSAMVPNGYHASTAPTVATAFTLLDPKEASQKHHPDLGLSN